MSTEDNTQADQCLAALKALISNDKKLADLNFKFDDDFLLRFVRGRKYSPEKAFKTLQQYCIVRREKYPQVFKTMKPSNCRAAFDSKVIGYLKHNDNEGRRVFFAQSEPWDVQKYSYESLLSASILLTDEILGSPEVQEKGIILVFDYNKFTYRQMMTLNLTRIRMVTNILQNAIPLKIKAIHCVNATRFYYYSYQLLKHLQPEKWKNRYHVHWGTKSFHDFMSSDKLPDWLGGSLSHEEATDKDLFEKVYNNEHLYGNNSQFTLQ